VGASSQSCFLRFVSFALTNICFSQGEGFLRVPSSNILWLECGHITICITTYEADSTGTSTCGRFANRNNTDLDLPLPNNCSITRVEDVLNLYMTETKRDAGLGAQ